MDSAPAKESKKESKQLDTETKPNHNANLLLMYKKSIWQESCHIDFSNTLQELAVTMCFIQKKINMARILPY
jgi:hypothetical protein